MKADADRNLLFGLLALQNGMVDQDRLVAAFHVWSRDQARPIADLLADHDGLDVEQRALIDGLVAQHVKKHGGSTERSLAALDLDRIRQNLARIDDPVIETTLGHIGLRPGTDTVPVAEVDPDRTASFSVGSATSDGQRFRVLRPHAKGGLGAVFVALDTELHREVALKQILDSHADDSVSRARFLVEAEITGGLEHPGIVPVYGLGTYGGGRPYYAMRFIRGDSLKETIGRFHSDEARKREPGHRSLELRKLLRRFTDVCNAIEYAHTRGVLHRDIKPSNVIVGHHGETLVVDWGLAKATGKSDPASGERMLRPNFDIGSTETLPGSALGTPAFMSPEQAEGDLERLGPRSDVYSLGATLYCLLTGVPPFAGDAMDVIPRVQRGDFRPPRAIVPSVDRALEAVCLKAMALQPADRYVTPKALAEDIERWMADEPVSAWREPFARRARRWARRNRTAVTAAAVAVVAGVVGLAAVLAVQTRAKAELAQSLANETKANRELARSRADVQARYDLAVEAIGTFHTGVSEDFLLKQDQFRELRDRLLKSASNFYDKLGALLGKESDLAARRALLQANFEVAELTRKVGKNEDSLAAHRKLLADREALAVEPEADAELKADVGRSLVAVAALLEATGQSNQALATYSKAEGLLAMLAGSAQASASTRSALAVCRSQRGWLLYQSGHTDDGLKALRLAWADQEALAAAPGAMNEPRRDLAATARLIGRLLTETGKPAEAEAEFRKALAILQKLADDNPAVSEFRSGLAIIHNNLGILSAKTGKPAEAEAEFRMALAIVQELADDYAAVTKFRNFVAAGHGSLAGWLWQTGKPAGAEAELRKALAIFQKLADDNPAVIEFPKELALSHNNLGIMLKETGQPAEAEAEFREALAIFQKLADDNPAVTEFRNRLANTHNNLGNMLKEADKLVEAEAELRKAQVIRLELADDNLETPDHRNDVASGHTNLADVLRSLGRLAEARDDYERAVVIRERLVNDHTTVPLYHSHLAYSLRRRGLARRNLGDPAGAAADVRRALGLYEDLPSRTVEEWYETACCRAALAGLAGVPGSGLSAAEGESEADKAIGVLRKALAMGHRNPAMYRSELALDPLRARPDFQALMMDLAFPAEPFARGD